METSRTSGADSTAQRVSIDPFTAPSVFGPPAPAHPEIVLQMPEPDPASDDRSVARGRRKSQLRLDVEGLRAIAVLMVLLYHAGVPFLRGGFAGVDVFFVISGFLITAQLVSELDQRGHLSLASFYARRAKRLLPAVGVVLAATTILIRFCLPSTRWDAAGGDLIAAALYVVNWHLADRSVDYLAVDTEHSPVQHFWSLAVEEQYYLAWPALILLAVFAARHLGIARRYMVRIVITIVVVASFLASVVQSATDPARAFFVTTTRVWELGIGGAVVLSAAFWKARRGQWTAIAGWVGLGVVIASAVVFSPSAVWPGYLAALPVLGTASVIAVGFAGRSDGPIRFLRNGVLRWIGGLSYSLYLWHWPLLVAAGWLWPGLSWGARLLVCAVSFLPAWLTHRLVENPIRYARAMQSSPRFALSIGLNFTLVGLVAGALLLSGTPAPKTNTPARTALGAAVLGSVADANAGGVPVDDVGWMTPTPAEANDDMPSVYRRGCSQAVAESEVISCDYGVPDGKVSVVVVGDSKMAQWMPALEAIAERNSWKVRTYFKSLCSFSLADTVQNTTTYMACRQWSDAVLVRLLADRPDFVLTSQLRHSATDPAGGSSDTAMAKGLRQMWSRLTAKGSKVIVVADNPGPDGYEIPDCVEQHPKALTKCSFDRAEALSRSAAPTLRAAAQGQTGVSYVDFIDGLCPASRCPAVIGNVLVYRQGSHLTATYVTTLIPLVAAELAKKGIPAERP